MLHTNFITSCFTQFSPILLEITILTLSRNVMDKVREPMDCSGTMVYKEILSMDLSITYLDKEIVMVDESMAFLYMGISLLD